MDVLQQLARFLVLGYSRDTRIRKEMDVLLQLARFLVLGYSRDTRIR
jgi:hypothetical protein